MGALLNILYQHVQHSQGPTLSKVGGVFRGAVFRKPVQSGTMLHFPNCSGIG